MSSDSDCEIPEAIVEEVRIATLNLLPAKSRLKYENEYNTFKKWMTTSNVKKINDDVILAYFSFASKKYKSSTLWAKYSMLRTTLLLREDIEIKKQKLINFLKRQAVGYKPKKAKTFSREDINKFISEAPDEIYLFMKVNLIVL